jgi:phospholipid/cholesterol/gamma-HCH transport system substrate-binding protein
LRLRAEAKVGLLVAASILALIASYWFLGRWLVQGGGYILQATFKNIRRLDRGADVRLAGVKVGQVQDIELIKGSRVLVTMLISRKYDVPAGSQAVVTTGGLIGDVLNEIVPGQGPGNMKPGEMLGSAEKTNVEDIMGQARGLLKDLRVAAKNINSLLGDKKAIGNIKLAIANMKLTTDRTAALIAEAQSMIAENKPEFAQMMKRLSAASADVETMSRRFKNVTEPISKQRIEALMKNAGDAMANLKIASENIKSLAQGEEIGDVKALLKNASAAMENLKYVSESLRSLAQNEQFVGDVKQTAVNAEKATRGAAELMDRLNRVLQRKKSPYATRPPSEGTRLDFL